MSSKMESSLGKVSFNRHQAPKVLTVEDSTDESFQNTDQSINDAQARLDRLRDLEALKRETKQIKQQAPAVAKNRLDILLGIARSARDVEVDGIVFSIRSLKAKEIQEITEKLLEANTTNEVINRLETRKHMIARSLYAIDNQDIDLVIGATSIDDRVE